MRRYLSLSWKMLLLMLGMLLVLLLGFTSLSLLHMDEQFQRQQAERKAQGLQYFTFYNQAIEQQLLTWIQSYAALQQLDKAEDFNDFSHQLSLQADLLQMNFAVNQLSLYDSEHQLLLQSGGALPARANEVLQRTAKEQRPQSVVYCDGHCSKLMGLPLLNGNGDVAIVLLSADLTEVLYSLHQTLGVEVAVLNYPTLLRSGLSGGLLQASDRELAQRIYQQLIDNAELTTIGQQGAQVKLEQQYYYLHRIILDPLQPDAYMLIMLEDISKVLLENQRYQQKVYYLAAVCFAGMGLMLLVMSRRISRRILRLARKLPLLAQRRYTEFRQSDSETKVLLADELSLFNTAVNTLTDDLEKLDTALAEKTASLERMAMFDQLTGLGNRNMLQYQLQLALAALKLQPGAVGLVFLDLDKFKNINNSHSHAVGDSLLIETAARLRQLASSGQVVCRFGGDEFAIVLPHLSNSEQAEQLAEEVLTVFNRPFAMQRGSVTVTASIGVSVSYDTHISAEEMIRQADLAMYQAKNDGRNCIYRFNEQMSADLANRLLLEAELRQAIAKQQFFLAYQPQVDLATGKLSGFEALIRWQHPQRGIVAPDDFITVLEQTQLIVDVGYWVFAQACQQCKILLERGMHDIQIAVNLSAVQFLQSDLPEKFGQILQQYSVDARHFELELTESTLVSQVSQTLDVMYRLKNLGFRFAIDDFGTGYSSLNYLKRMPVDVIKIDKSFVQGMLENASDHQIVVSTIAMVQKLGLQIVAEGVESLAHLQLLQRHHCDYVQGYYLAKPIAQSELADFIDKDVTEQDWPAQLLR